MQTFEENVLKIVFNITAVSLEHNLRRSFITVVILHRALSYIIATFQIATWGRFHKSWAQSANHRDSSIKVGPMAQSALYAFKKLLKNWV